MAMMQADAGNANVTASMKAENAIDPEVMAAVFEDVSTAEEFDALAAQVREFLVAQLAKGD